MTGFQVLRSVSFYPSPGELTLAMMLALATSVQAVTAMDGE